MTGEKQEPKQPGSERKTGSNSENPDSPVGEVRLDSNGLTCIARVTRTGVLDYPEKGRRELRPAEELFKADSYRTLIGKPVVLTHRHGLVTPENFKKATVGSVSGVWPDGLFLMARLHIHDREGIEAIQDGMIEISPGLTCEPDFSSGSDPEPYDLIQRNIQYNHVAIVQTGRAGPDARIVAFDEASDMKKIKIGDKEFEIPDEVSAHIATLEKKQGDADQTAKMDSLRGELAASQASLSEALKSKAELSARLDGLENGQKDFTRSDTFKDAVKEHAGILAVAQTRLDEAELAKLGNADSDALRRAVIAKALPDVKLDGASPDFLDGMFRTLTALPGDSAADSNAAAQSRAATGKSRFDSSNDPVVVAIDAFNEGR